MELNREQIIKALECCKVGDDCWACPYDNVGVYSQCVPKLLEDALALIKELTEENERLTLEKTGFEAGVKAGIKVIRANTIREMHAEIINRCTKGGIYPAFVASTINKIAKEMLEDTDES